MLIFSDTNMKIKFQLNQLSAVSDDVKKNINKNFDYFFTKIFCSSSKLINLSFSITE